MDPSSPPRLEPMRRSSSPYARSPRRGPPSLLCEKPILRSNSPKKKTECEPSTSAANDDCVFDEDNDTTPMFVPAKGTWCHVGMTKGTWCHVGMTKGTWCQVGMTVLARWTDGLIYLGNVEKVEKEKCFVTFEDNSKHWVLSKDIQKARHESESSEDITCSICEEGTSSVPNEIVMCDSCGAGYHQLCHQPAIDMSVVQNEDKLWNCRDCIFANSVKVGGATRTGPAAKVYQEVKSSLPYKLDDLSWDTAHRSNSQRCYCYCGGPGDWYLKMLQCCRCLQWFHEACVQCIDIPMLYGDIFYLFICSICNSGPEYLQRLPLKWSDVAHLILYNLTLKHRKKYYDFDDEMMPFLTEIWNNLQVPHLSTATRSGKQEYLKLALLSSKTRIACGREVKKKKNLFALRIRSPPIPPTIQLPAEGQITEELMRELQITGRKVVKFKAIASLSPPGVGKKRGRKKKILSPQATPASLASPNATHSNLPSPCVSSSQQKSILDTIEPFPIVYKRHNMVPGQILPKRRTFAASFPHLPSTSNNFHQNSKQELFPKIKKKRGRKPKYPRLTENESELSAASSDLSQSENFVDVEQMQSHLRLNGYVDGRWQDAKDSGKSYSKAERRIASGEIFKVLGKRKTTEGKVEYLIEWEGTAP